MVKSNCRAIRRVGTFLTLIIRPLPIDRTTPRSVKVIFILQPPPGRDVTWMAPSAGHTKEVSSGTCHSQSGLCGLYRNPILINPDPPTGPGRATVQTGTIPDFQRPDPQYVPMGFAPHDASFGALPAGLPVPHVVSRQKSHHRTGDIS